VVDVFEAVKNMEKNKAPRPGGFLEDFYQTFWAILRDD
jgi:hypothetical protein